MKRKASPLLIGGFVVFGLALLAVAILAVAGNKLFTRKERAVMHFSGSVYGLQVGAPVVFRGVRVGSVESIQVFYDRASDSFSIPVVVDLEGDAVSGLDGKPADADVALALPALIQRGLSAQLAMQSLLTGLLYVDLDLRPQRGTRVRGNSYRELTEIPTTATAIQALKNQLEGMDFRRLADDVGAIAASARAVLSGPQLKQSLADLAQITANIKQLTGRIDRRVDPLADALQHSLGVARTALDRVGRAADGAGVASDRAAALLAPDSPLLLRLQQTAEELARTAVSLRRATAADGTLAQGTERTLADLSRAARAVRDLAEALDQQPESLLRGRKAATP
jgi:paraquat-inducible protein B